jgi:hypothetical protein
MAATVSAPASITKLRLVERIDDLPLCRSSGKSSKCDRKTVVSVATPTIASPSVIDPS